MAIFSDMPTEGEIEDLYGEFCLHDRNEQGLVDIHTMVTLMQNATDQKDFWDEEKASPSQDQHSTPHCTIATFPYDHLRYIQDLKWAKWFKGSFLSCFGILFEFKKLHGRLVWEIVSFH